MNWQGLKQLYQTIWNQCLPYDSLLLINNLKRPFKAPTLVPSNQCVFIYPKMSTYWNVTESNSLIELRCEILNRKCFALKYSSIQLVLILKIPVLCTTCINHSREDSLKHLFLNFVLIFLTHCSWKFY